MNQIKVGVVGVGRMGQRHCRVFSNMRKAQLSGICDSDAERGKRIAAQYEVPFYEEIDELMDHVDAVSLATPTQLHFEQAIHCLNRGAHLMIEKPMTETLSQAEQLAQLAEAVNSVVQVGHIERFNPAYIELKNVIEGTSPFAVTFNRLSPYQGSNKDVDVVLDLMIHDTNLVLDLVGKSPVRINAYGMTAFSGTVDHAVANLEFEGGPILSMVASRVTEHKVRTIQVTNPEAYLDCDLLNKSISVHRCTIGEYLSYNHRGVKYRQESIVERINVPTFEPLLLEFQHFVDCILEGTTPAVTARDGFDALKLATSIRDAILPKMIDMKAITSQQNQILRPVTGLSLA